MDTIMLRMASLGKSKKSKTATSPKSGSSGELVSPKAASSPKGLEKIEKTRSGIVARITGRASLRSRRTKSGDLALDVRSKRRVLDEFETELAKAFNVFDSNRDGKISVTELGAVLRSLGNEITQEDLQHIMKDVDADQDGFISLNEFIDFNKVMVKTPNRSDDGIITGVDSFRVAFDIFDKDGNNLISPDELQVVLHSLGDEHTLEDCRRMISNVDQDGDGFVNYKEFKVMMGPKS